MRAQRIKMVQKPEQYVYMYFQVYPWRDPEQSGKLLWSLDSQYIYLFMTIWSVSDFVFRLLQLIIFVFVLSDNSILRDELESDSEGEDVTSSSDARSPLDKFGKSKPFFSVYRLLYKSQPLHRFHLLPFLSSWNFLPLKSSLWTRPPMSTWWYSVNVNTILFPILKQYRNLCGRFRNFFFWAAVTFVFAWSSSPPAASFLLE